MVPQSSTFGKQWVIYICFVRLLCYCGVTFLEEENKQTPESLFLEVSCKIQSKPYTALMDGFGHHVFLSKSCVMEETEGNPNSQTPEQRSDSFPVLSARQLLSATSQLSAPPQCCLRHMPSLKGLVCGISTLGLISWDHEQRFKGPASKRRAPGIISVRLPGVVPQHLTGDQKMLLKVDLIQY